MDNKDITLKLKNNSIVNLSDITDVCADNGICEFGLNGTRISALFIMKTKNGDSFYVKNTNEFLWAYMFSQEVSGAIFYQILNSVGAGFWDFEVKLDEHYLRYNKELPYGRKQRINK